MFYMKYDLHIHSKYSYDSFMSPRNIIKIAKKVGLAGIAITDHNTIKGGVEAYKSNKDINFCVIIGAEIKTNYGDIIGLFLNEEIKSRNFIDVINEIRSQNGLSILAHPYRHYGFPEEIVGMVDMIEAFNARSKKESNNKARVLANRFEKATTAGSDAHLYFEIGKGKTIVNGELEETLRKGHPNIEGFESNYYLVHGMSVVIEKIKRMLI